MSLKSYLKDHIIHILFSLLLIIVVEAILILFCTTLTLQAFVDTVILFIIVSVFLYDYARCVKFYNDFEAKLSQLQEKYFIAEMLTEPSFYQGKILYNSLVEITKSMNDEIQNHIRISNEFKKYVETWVHEIKLPIAALKLMVHNHQDFATRKMNIQIKKIDSCVEQVLYYIRSEVPQNDYVIGQCSLKKIVDTAIRDNKDILILNHFVLEEHVKDVTILTDEKWLVFMIGQIISNSVKYTQKENKKLCFFSEKFQRYVKLVIEDNGIGIEFSDLPRVFDKSFTGQNGHHISVSTGMGLYLCKQLCTELGHDIEIESQKDEYTRVILTINTVCHEA